MPKNETVLSGLLTLNNKSNTEYLTTVSPQKAKEKDQYDKCAKDMKSF
jgi:hypothetical protein